MRNKIFELTPLGRADIELKDYLGAKKNFEDKKEYKNYQQALSRYRDLKMSQLIVKVLLYAGLVTSVAASIGLEQLEIINRVASYLGFTVLAIAYIMINYAKMLQREEYHVRREILISNTKIEQSMNGDSSEE